MHPDESNKVGERAGRYDVLGEVAEDSGFV